MRGSSKDSPISDSTTMHEDTPIQAIEKITWTASRNLRPRGGSRLGRLFFGFCGLVSPRGVDRVAMISSQQLNIFLLKRFPGVPVRCLGGRTAVRPAASHAPAYKSHG